MGNIFGVISRLTRRMPIFWAVIYFSCLAVLMTWPLVTRMGSQMVGQVGDNIYFVWMIAWIRKALFELHVNPFNVWFLNYPEGWNMAYTEITPAQLALAIPFSFLGGAVFGYNVAVLLGFILSGLTMFLWVRHLTGRLDAALISGTIFAFLPFRFAHFLIGHLNLSGTQWFPLYFWGFFDILTSQRTNLSGLNLRKSVIIGGIGLGLIALTSQYYLYMAMLVSGLILIVDLLFLDRGRWKDRKFWKWMVSLGLVSLPLVTLAVAPYIQLSQAGGLPDRSLSIVRPYSAGLTDFLIPSTQHFLWGSWVGSHFNRQMWVEGTLYIGAVTIFLTALAWTRRKQLEKEHLLALLLCGSGFAALLAMGTDIHWNGYPVEISLPAFLADKVHRSSIPILLPGYFLFLYFPLYAKLRALMRFGVLVLVFFPVGAGLGAVWLLGRVKTGWRTIAAVGLLTLIFIDFYPGPYSQFVQIEPRPVDAWLAQQPGNGAVIQFPFIKGEDQEQTYYTLFHGKPFVGGFFNAFPPPQYQKVKPLMENFPDQTSVSLLKQLGAEFILLDRSSYTNIDSVRQKCEDLGLQFVTEQAGQLVFEPTK